MGVLTVNYRGAKLSLEVVSRLLFVMYTPNWNELHITLKSYEFFSSC
jgi:hypothetical protein